MKKFKASLGVEPKYVIKENELLDMFNALLKFISTNCQATQTSKQAVKHIHKVSKMLKVKQ